MANQPTADERSDMSRSVEVATEATGSDEYQIIATSIFDSPPEVVWELLKDWERFVAVGLPGLTKGFKWLDGSPDRVPSTFQFELAGAILLEEIYERTAVEITGQYRLCYRTLEPALGVLEYDAVLELRRTPDGRTAFSAERNVRLLPGTGPEMLEGVIQSETQCLKDHFAV